MQQLINTLTFTAVILIIYLSLKVFVGWRLRVWYAKKLTNDFNDGKEQLFVMQARGFLANTLYIYVGDCDINVISKYEYFGELINRCYAGGYEKVIMLNSKLEQQLF